MNPQLTTRLRHLSLSGMVEALPGRVAQAEAAPLPHLEFLELLVEDELARRADLIQQLTRVDLLVLEDFGMKKLAANAAEGVRPYSDRSRITRKQ